MTVLADRLVCFGLKNLEQIMPDKPAPVIEIKADVPAQRKTA